MSVYVGNRAFSKKPTNSGRGIVFGRVAPEEQEQERGVILRGNRAFNNAVAPFQGGVAGTPSTSEEEYELTAEEIAEEAERAAIIARILNALGAVRNTPEAIEYRRISNLLSRGGRSSRQARAEMALREEARQAETTGRGIGSSRNAVAPDEAPRGQMRYVRVAPRRETPPLGGMEVQFSPEELARLAALRADRARLAALGIQLQGTSNSLENIWR